MRIKDNVLSYGDKCIIVRNENEIKAKQQALQAIVKDIADLAKQNREIKGRAYHGSEKK